MEPDQIALNSDSSPPWSSTTVVIVSILLLLLVGLAVYFFRIVFVPLIVGTIIAYIFRPLVRFIHRRTRLPRGLSAGLLYLLLLAVLIPSSILLIPSLVEALQLLQREILTIVRLINEMSADTTFEVLGFAFSVQEATNEITAVLANFARSLASQSLDLVGRVARVLLLTVFTILISFYLTRDHKTFIQAFSDLVPRDYRGDAHLLFVEIDKVWSSFFRGQIILSLIVTVILTVISAALGLPQPVMFGIWGGLLEFLPSIGNIIWGTTAIVTALVAGSTYLPVPNTTFALIVLVVYIVFAQVDINILIPNIIGRHVRLHPMVVIIGVIIGIQMGGVLGVALAAPTIASLRVLGRYVYAKLFGMYPFPMVGPPSAPWRERLALIQEEQEVAQSSSPPDSGGSPDSES